MLTRHACDVDLPEMREVVDRPHASKPVSDLGRLLLPISEQDVVRVDHRHGIEDLTRLGTDVERAVLSRAVLWHRQDRIIRHGNQTIVFWCNTFGRVGAS